MTKISLFLVCVVLLLSLFTVAAFAVAGGSGLPPDPPPFPNSVFWFAIQPDGVNLMINPEWGINSIELVIELQPVGLNFSTSPLFAPGDWLTAFNVVVGPARNTQIHVAAAGITPIEDLSKLFRIDIYKHVGPVRIVFKKAQVNGWSGVETIDLIANGRVENNFDFFISPRIGDVNADGIISVADAMAVLMHIIGAEELTPAQWARADVTGLGGVTARDALEILYVSAGIKKEFSPYSGKGAPGKNGALHDSPVTDIEISELEKELEEGDLLADEVFIALGRLGEAISQSPNPQGDKLLSTWGRIKR